MACKIILISPIGRSVLGRTFCFKLPFLSLPTVAAYTPEDCRVTIVDERVDAIDFSADADLVGITVMTPLAVRAYEIADRFRARGIKVVMGGIHVSALPEEALEHADAVIVGEAEHCWPQVIEDARSDHLQRIYRADQLADLTQTRPPRWEASNESAYMPVRFIESTRGCPFCCSFCAVTNFFGGKYRVKPVELVEEQLCRLKPVEKFWSLKNVVFFVDDNIIGHRGHCVELLETIKKYDIQWFGQASLSLAQHDDLLQMMAESRCRGLEIGIESLSSESLEECGKRVNKPEQYLQAIEKIHSYGIGIQASFMVGFDHDDTSVFRQIERFIRKARIEIPFFSILTPYPGTRVFNEMQAENRLLHTHWELYDTAHVVYKPRLMSPEQLHQGYKWLFRKAFSMPSMLSRLGRSRAFPAFFIPTNFGYRHSMLKMLRYISQ